MILPIICSVCTYVGKEPAWIQDDSETGYMVCIDCAINFYEERNMGKIKDTSLTIDQLVQHTHYTGCGYDVPEIQAQRFDQGKPQLSYIDLSCLEPCARVLEFGSKKYSRDNWKLGMETSKIIDSLLRHLSAIQRGEIKDPESGELHIGHVQANALFLGNPKNIQDLKVMEIKDDEKPS